MTMPLIAGDTIAGVLFQWETHQNTHAAILVCIGDGRWPTQSSTHGFAWCCPTFNDRRRA